MICAVCKDEVTEFACRSNRCKPCHNKYTRQHYKENKAAYLESARRSEKRRMDFIREVKNVPCADCKKRYHYCQMDFDHIEKKDFDIGTDGKSVSKERLLIEIKKCEVVCSNCHRMRTHKRLQGSIA